MAILPDFRSFKNHRIPIKHSQGPWEEHKYVKVIDGDYYYPDSYEGGRHLPNGSAAKAGATAANVGKETAKKQISNSTSASKTSSSTKSSSASESTSKTASESGVVTRGGALGLFKKSDLRKKSGKSLSELEKLLKETRSENERDKKAAEERLKKALATVSTKSVSKTEVKTSDIKKVEEVVKKIEEEKKKEDNSPDLSKVYNVYKKKR